MNPGRGRVGDRDEETEKEKKQNNDKDKQHTEGLGVYFCSLELELCSLLGCSSWLHWLAGLCWCLAEYQTGPQSD